MTMPETTQSDLVERRESLSFNLYLECAGLQNPSECFPVGGDFTSMAELLAVIEQAERDASEITRLRAEIERLRKIESQIDGGRFDEWPTATFVGQLHMQARDNLDPEYSQFMAATANRMESLRAHCEAIADAADGVSRLRGSHSSRAVLRRRVAAYRKENPDV